MLFPVPQFPTVVLRDEKAQNTAGGTATTGAWRTRTLNTEATDTHGLCTLSSNQLTLAAGTWEIWACAPGFSVQAHQARLYNVTDTALLILGSAEYSSSAAFYTQTLSIVAGRFTIAASKALEIQHYPLATQATYGFGNPANVGTEVYTQVVLRKVG